MVSHMVDTKMPAANVNKSQKKSAQCRTPKQVRAWLDAHGVTQKQIANQIGVPHQVIRDLLRDESDPSRLKGTRGDAHTAAVALGLKPAPEGVSPIVFASMMTKSKSTAKRRTA